MPNQYVAKFDEPTIKRCLQMVVACAGSQAEAARRLKERGIEIGAPTLGIWCRTQYAEMYEEIRREKQPEMEAALEPEFREVIAQSMRVERKLLDKLERQLNSNQPIRDPARAVANVAKVKQVATDKLMTLTGRPERITEERRNPDEIIRALRAAGIPIGVQAIEGEAEEIEEPDEA